MAGSVTCICGSRGPAVTAEGRDVCPICRTPAVAAAAAHTFRIPCPRGHVLQASERMLDQQVVCPQCNEVFTLRVADSIEHRKERKRLEREREERDAKRWLTRAIWAAAFIMASLIGMIVFSFLARPQPDADSTAPHPAAQSE